VADHFQYLANIGMIVLAVGIAMKFSRRLQLARLVSLLAATVILLALGGITYLRTFDYRDRETLWTVTMLDNPECWLAPWILAEISSSQGRTREAALYFDRARELKLKQPFEPAALAELHAWSARCQAQMGNPRQFEHHRNECLKYMQEMLDDPFLKPLDAHVQRGILYRRFNMTDQAAAEFRRALELDPLHAEGNCELGDLLSAAGQFDESEEAYRRALQRDPHNVRSRFELAQLYQKQGKTDLARAEAKAVLRIRPDFTPARKLVEQLSSSAN
jgi:tetratricopeptide (TPR) repeat protein